MGVFFCGTLSRLLPSLIVKEECCVRVARGRGLVKAEPIASHAQGVPADRDSAFGDHHADILLLDFRAVTGGINQREKDARAPRRLEQRGVPFLRRDGVALEIEILGQGGIKLFASGLDEPSFDT